MRTNSVMTVALIALASSVGAPAQSLTLCPPPDLWPTTTLAFMCDVENTTSVPLEISSLCLFGGGTFELFRTTSANSYVGLENTPSAWTQIGGIFTASNQNPIVCDWWLTCTPEVGLRLAPGEKVGLYIRFVGAIFFASNVTRPTTGPYRMWFGNTHVSISTGIIAGPSFGIVAPGIWEHPMAAIYSLGDADLSATFSTQAPQGLTIDLSNYAPTGTVGYTLVSTATVLPVGTGPVLGLYPDATTLGLLSTPYFPGNPLHFHPSDTGVFPNVPWFANQQELIGLSGVSLDLVSIFLDASGTLVDQSRVQRVLIP